MTTCPYCGDENVFTYFYIEKMPTILSACDKNKAKWVRTHPFRAMACGQCWLGFNADPLNEKEYKEIYDDYLYISPMEGIGQSKYKNMVHLIKKLTGKADRIVDVGCADGYLLHRLKQSGYENLMGIEPSILSEKGLLNGLDIVNGYFSSEIFDDNSVDCFVLMHVFEHFKDPFSVLKDMKKKLTFDGRIVMEVPYFSGEHHQHLFFYNLTFLKRLCQDSGMSLNIAEVDYDTETLRVVISRNRVDFNVEALERPVDILDLCLRKNDENKLKIERINELIKRKKGIVWWGAGSTSVTYLNQIDLNGTRLTVVDGDKNKWGLYIPVINEKVYPYTVLNNRKLDEMIVASSFVGEIKNTLKANDISVNRLEVFA